MLDLLAALLPPAVMAGVVIAFVVWLYRSQLAKRSDDGDDGDDEQDIEPERDDSDG